MIRSVLVALTLAAAPGAHAGTVEITVTNLRATTGHVRVEVCAEAQFAKSDNIPCPYRAEAPAAQPDTIIRIDHVPPGTYGAQGYYDEKDWKALRHDFFGRPEEGVGFSRDAPFRFGPPAFADGAFTVPTDGVAHVKMTLRYFD